MQKRFFRALCGLLLLCVLCAGLSGCMDLTFENLDSAPVVTLPTPDVSSMSAPMGDSRASYSIRATLYYRTSDGQLSSALRLIHVDPEDDELELILESLLETPYSSSGLLPIAPEGTRLLGVSLLSGVATVDLSAQALKEGEEYFWIARAAIAKTLLGRDGITAVNVLVEGRAAETGGMPLGAVIAQDLNASAGYMQQLSEQVLLESEGGYIDRSAVLYLPDAHSGLLLPETVSVRLYADDFIAPVLQAFAQAAAGANWTEDQLSLISAQVSLTTAGKRLLTVHLPDGLSDAQDLLAPAIGCTLSSFLPNIDAVRVYIGSEPLYTAGMAQADSDGLFPPEALRALAGTAVELYFRAEDGSLVRCTHALAGRSLSARALLALLMDGPSAADPADVLDVFPSIIDQADILGVHIEAGVAHVHLSSALYSACQSFSADQERALVYAMVNTLVYNLDTVSRVQFYINDAVADTFAGTISILTPLMANPGLARN